MYIVSYGDIFDGHRFFGPFKTHSDARAFTEGKNLAYFCIFCVEDPENYYKDKPPRYA